MSLQDVFIALKNIAKAINDANKTLQSTYSQISNTISASATTGANGAPPGQVAGYANVTINGTPYKIPLYNP